jgi:DNA polymerase-3 subunit alpha
VHLLVTHHDAEALITCGARWFVTPEDQLLHDLKQCLGEKAVSILYH